MTQQLVRRTVAATATLAATAALLGTAAPATSAESAEAAAAPRTKVVVTIKAQGTDLSGTVRSSRRVCKKNRTVLLYLQRGKRGGGNDELFATDTTEIRKGVGHWETGNLGFEGKFYAKVKGTPLCKPAVSRTVVAERDD